MESQDALIGDRQKRNVKGYETEAGELIIKSRPEPDQSHRHGMRCINTRTPLRNTLAPELSLLDSHGTERRQRTQDQMIRSN